MRKPESKTAVLKDLVTFKNNSKTRNTHVLIWLFLVVATSLVYQQILYYEFIDLDDYEYVVENRQLQNGLTLENVMWAFTDTHNGNWHPLTWLSHMLDCRIFGLDPGWHHFTNLIFHLANALLLFSLLRKMTGDLWQSGFVAALFALHPLQVESVAWIAERKNLLSTFFWMATLCGYIGYVEKQNMVRYGWVLFLFVLGLMSKPMLVTLPFVMLLLDWWPLSRFQLEPSGSTSLGRLRPGASRLLTEKLPFFVFVIAASVVTFIVQKKAGAIGSMDAISIPGRIANAFVSYISYIGKMIWPFKLAVLYPHPVAFSWWKVTGSFALLTTITVFVIRNLCRRPWLAVGWFWYMGTLVPVIGLVQVGVQSMADRYAYVPMIGLSIMIAWGIPSILERVHVKKTGLTIITAVVLSSLMTITWLQAKYWKNSLILFQHALGVTRNNHLLHNNLGFVLANIGRIDEAVEHYQESIRIKPDFPEPHNNLGIALARQGRIDEAMKHYREALRKKPDFEKAHNNLAIALFYKGNIDEAISHLQEAIRINPDYTNAKQNLRKILKDREQTPE